MQMTRRAPRAFYWKRNQPKTTTTAPSPTTTTTATTTTSPTIVTTTTASSRVHCASAPAQSNSTHGQTMDLAKLLGVTHYRYAFEIGWGTEALDYIVAGCASRGLRLVLCVFRNDRVLPADATAATSYANSVVSLLGRTNGLCDFVELWNEPNNSNFSTTRSATDWARAVVAGHAAVKAAYPNIKTISGGLSPAGGSYQPNTFFLAACTANASMINSFDYVGWHPYCFPHTPLGNESWNAMKQAVDLWNSLKTNYSKTVEFAATEFGAPSNYLATDVTPNVQFDEAKQAQWMDYYRTAFNTRGPAWALESVFTIRDGNAGTGTAWEPSCGMYRADNTAKPAAAVRMTL